MINLRPYQSQGILDIREAFRNGSGAVVYTAPTGAGKTVLFTFMASEATKRNKRVLILMHRVELIRQTSDALKRLGVNHGIISPEYRWQSWHNVQVASVQTITRRVHKIPYAFDLIITDEAHHATASTYRTVYEAFPKSRLLGVTATPERQDGTGLIEIFQTLVNGPSVSDLIRDGYLSPYKLYAPFEVSSDTFRIKMGDFDASDISDAMDKPKIVGDVVDVYAKYSKGLPAVYFCVTVKNAQHQADAFRAAGINAVSVDGNMSDADRRDAISGLASGKYHVLTSCQIISEGTDIPVITTVGQLRHTASLALHLQQIGRGLRTHPNKTHCIWLDHVGNHKRHGFPDDERIWTLEGKKRTKKSVQEEPELKIIQCEKCYHVYRPAEALRIEISGTCRSACPSCRAVAETKQRREIETAPGELVEIDPRELRRQRGIEMSRIKSYEDAVAYGLAKGYKPGWAWNYWNFKKQKIAVQSEVT